MSSTTRICVFCGSKTGAKPVFAESARSLGTEIARRGHGLVFGAGNIGLMNAVADAVLASGGHVTGVIPESMVRAGLEHRELQDLRVVKTMHERKALMVALPSGFVALPGGLGTFEELLEVFTWLQLGIHRNAVGVLNVDGYYDSLLALLDRAVSEGFLKPMYVDALIVEREPEPLLERIEGFVPPEDATITLEWTDL